MPTITIRPLIASARRSGVEVGRADELEHDVGAALGRARATSSAGSITVAPSAATASRSSGGATVASTRAPAAAAICTAAVPTPPFAPLTTSSSPGRSPAWVITASCAVTNASGTAAAASSSSCSGTAVTWSSCDEHVVREPASADEPEDPVAGSEPRERVGPQAITVPETSMPGDVGRRAGWGRVVAVPLGEVGGVEPRVADGDENVVARRAGVAAARRG